MITRRRSNKTTLWASTVRKPSIAGSGPDRQNVGQPLPSPSLAGRCSRESDPSTPDEPLSAKLDTTVPHSARIWNYWLGGKDNFAVDREAGDQYIAVFPGIVDDRPRRRGRSSRARSRYLAGEAGMRQFLDVGTGLPTADNTHEVAQRVAPESRIVYVDNDPLVLVHARALLAGTPEGATDYIDADLHDPERSSPAPAETLDFAQPVALILSGILGHVPDYGEARDIVSRLMAASRRAAISRSTTGPGWSPVRHSPRRRTATTTPVRCRTSSEPPKRSPASSPGWSSSNRGSSRARCGGPTPATTRGTRRVRWRGPQNPSPACGHRFGDGGR